MQCQTEEDCLQLVRLLPPTESALLDWAINLMADVVQQEHLNKMNARNVAMVFAPNMTQVIFFFSNDLLKSQVPHYDCQVNNDLFGIALRCWNFSIYLMCT